jgi:hypothetical protein
MSDKDTFHKIVCTIYDVDGAIIYTWDDLMYNPHSISANYLWDEQVFNETLDDALALRDIYWNEEMYTGERDKLYQLFPVDDIKYMTDDEKDKQKHEYERAVAWFKETYDDFKEFYARDELYKTIIEETFFKETLQPTIKLVFSFEKVTVSKTEDGKFYLCT